MGNSTKQSVQDYYGRVLKSKDDLQTSACCTADAISGEMRNILMNVHEEVRAKFYGCGTPIPPEIKGATILDLGCGAGQDVYMLSQIVGPEGRVIGVDMTDEQLSVANKYIGWHMDRFGYDAPNVEFKKGFIEDLSAAGIEDDSIDIVISNCVINLSPDKKAVFKEIFRVLKPGGELYFSDVFSDKPIAPELMNDPVLLGECLSGAMHEGSFDVFLEHIGFEERRIVKQSPFAIENDTIRAKLEGIAFKSMTHQAFKPAACCGTSRKDLSTTPQTRGCC